eukprot:TRINITY_DN4601_c0_g1_i2.p1 TRINITY_DN4601_c0_g1~~TRINITY_DN4601_c0_g1_i2.p1  ORF type:complete len:252 (+),score=58.45 TRINITY_DN4601_c0_g1_i2:131-886(+)
MRLSQRYFIPSVLFNSFKKTNLHKSNKLFFSTTSTTMSEKVIDCTVISDSICPWCYVGKKKLEQALQDAPNVKVNITYKPFFLRDGLPKEGVPINEYLSKAYGMRDISRVNDHLNNVGREVGIEFNDKRLIANTLDSHRLIEYARQKGKQLEMVEAIFKRYFVGGTCISDEKMLADCAESIGFDRQEVLKYLESDENKDKVLNDIRDSKNKRVSGVPYFIFSTPGNPKKVSFSGAQPKEVFLKAFEAVDKQ